MKAIRFSKYGPPEKVLELREEEKPVPRENEVLVNVYTTAVNDYDWSLVRGRPHLYQLLFGVGKPKKQPGMELAGIVEALGPNATNFKVGDAVYGDTSEHYFGTMAEYVSVNEKALVHKPEKMSFEEAVSIPHASMLAVQGLIDYGNIQHGQKILINGGGGGVGTFGLQIARQFNAEVTGVDTGEKLEMMQALGFDHIIDYKKENFTKNGQQYDLILDCKTTRSPFTYARSLKKGGTYATVGGHLGRILQIALFRPFVSWFTKKSVCVVPLKPNKDLAYINELYNSGKIKCIIDGPYPLEKVP